MTTKAGPTHLDDIVVRDPTLSAMVDEPMRAMILDVLADEELTAGDVHERLAGRNIDRTENTIRHHINELRDAGLVEVARFEEGRGGTTKYYRANTIVLSYALPDDAAADVEALIDTAQPFVDAALDALTTEHADAIERVVSKMEPCAHCRTQKYEAYVLLTVLRRAFVHGYTDPA